LENKVKPTITFAIFTFNQEKFVKSSVAAAFQQTYQPLEIILSDDCSSDRTFEILQELADAYKGPHKVIVRKNNKNVGTYEHVMNVAEIAAGDLLVLSAGDDISKSTRVAKLADVWKLTGAWGLYSKYDRIDEDNNVLEINCFSKYLTDPNYSLRTYFKAEDGPVHVVHGVTSAYDKRIFEVLKFYNKPYILSEDGVLSFFINLFNEKIVRVDESLVLYREHLGSLTNAGNSLRRLTEKELIFEQNKSLLYTKSLANRAQFFLDVLNSLPSQSIRITNKKIIKKHQKIYQFKLDWPDLNFISRFKLLLLSYKNGHFKWILPRIFGNRVFITLKLLREWKNAIFS
jgi:glycosyltransferase involved in cell wall biosynthesis